MRAWKFEPKPEAMTKIRHGDSTGLVILENVAMDWGGDWAGCLSDCFECGNSRHSSFPTSRKCHVRGGDGSILCSLVPEPRSSLAIKPVIRGQAGVLLASAAGITRWGILTSNFVEMPTRTTATRLRSGGAWAPQP